MKIDKAEEKRIKIACSSFRQLSFGAEKIEGLRRKDGVPQTDIKPKAANVAEINVKVGEIIRTVFSSRLV